LFLIIGAAAPLFYFVYRRKKREDILVKQLPESIDMITRALKAGQSLDGALHEVGRSLPLPIGGEISTVYDEIAMGLPFESAIKNFEKRYPRIADIKILCTTFVIQRETGGNLTKILTGLATTIRERFKLKMQVKTLTAEGRVTSMILAMIPVAFALLTWFLNPKYISILFVHPMGKKILFFAFFLEGLGFYVMKRLSAIKV
ncbi:MAG: type II secretion system F family protein, partial [Desulfosarcina sp.]|nr:type II secretion system F family protein [Desulfobacterales bacterium]